MVEESQEWYSEDAQFNNAKAVVHEDVQDTLSTSHIQAAYVSPIAQPMASHKLTKKIRKLIKACDALQNKVYFRRSLRDVQSSLKKNETGLVIFAGDVTPIEVMCHLPALCEEKNIQYIYLPTRSMLRSEKNSKGSIVVLLKKHRNYEDLFDEVVEEINRIISP